MNRRKFTAAMGAVVAGMAAGSKAFAVEEKKADTAKKADEKKPKHICKGHNECKGQGGCAADAAKHGCAGKNECKGMGGCKSGNNGCAGKRSLASSQSEGSTGPHNRRVPRQGRLLGTGGLRAPRHEEVGS